MKQERYGFAAPIQIIAALIRTPRTIEQLVKLTGMSQPTVRSIVLAMRDTGHVYVKAWKVRPRLMAQRIYAFGEGEDAPCPGIPRSEAKTYRVEYCTRIVLKFIDAIQENALTRKEIIAVTELSPISCGKIIRLLRDHKLAHISSHYRKGHDGKWADQFIFGPGVDAKKPAAMTNAEKNKAMRNSRRALVSCPFKIAIRQIEAANEERRAA